MCFEGPSLMGHGAHLAPEVITYKPPAPGRALDPTPETRCRAAPVPISGSELAGIPARIMRVLGSRALICWCGFEVHEHSNIEAIFLDGHRDPLSYVQICIYVQTSALKRSKPQAPKPQAPLKALYIRTPSNPTEPFKPPTYIFLYKFIFPYKP